MRDDDYYDETEEQGPPPPFAAVAASAAGDVALSAVNALARAMLGGAKGKSGAGKRKSKDDVSCKPCAAHGRAFDAVEGARKLMGGGVRRVGAR